MQGLRHHRIGMQESRSEPDDGAELALVDERPRTTNSRRPPWLEPAIGVSSRAPSDVGQRPDTT